MPGITCTPVQKVLGAMTMSEAPTSPTSMSARTPCVKTLIVDDNVITAKLLSRILSREFGHFIVTVESGKDALTRLRAEAFDIIFMDIDMPELSGIETTMAIRSATSSVLEGNRTIPIIAYTTNPCERSYLDAGMKGWVGKPANNMAVRKELERVYTSRRRLSTAPQTVYTQQSC